MAAKVINFFSGFTGRAGQRLFHQHRTLIAELDVCVRPEGMGLA